MQDINQKIVNEDNPDQLIAQICEQKAKNENDKEGSKKEDQPLKMKIVDQRYRTEIQEIMKLNYSIKDLQDLTAALEGNIIRQHYGIIGIRRILSAKDQSERTQYIEQVIQMGLLPKMIQYVKQSQNPQLRMQAAWALANIASGSLAQCETIVKMDAIRLFTQLLQSDAFMEAAWGIANIASHSPKYQKIIIENGPIKRLINLIKNSTSNIQTLYWTLSNLVRGPETHHLITNKEAANVTRVFCKAILKGQVKDKNIRLDCFWSISYVTASRKAVKKLIQANFIPILVAQLRQESEFTIPSLRTIGNISTGSQQDTSQLLKHDIINVLFKVLYFSRKIMRRHCCWVLSNIAAESTEKVNSIMSHQALIQRLLYLFNYDSNATRYKICRIFSNLTHAGDKLKLIQLYKRTQIIHYYFKALAQTNSSKLPLILQCLWHIARQSNEFYSDGSNDLFAQMTDDEVDLLNKLEYHECFQKSNTGNYQGMIREIKQSRKI